MDEILARIEKESGSESGNESGNEPVSYEK